MCVLVCPSCVASGTSWLGVWCGGVWWGVGCCRAPPLLAGVLGRVRVCVWAPLVPRFSWGCAGVAVGGVCPPPPLWFFFWGGGLCSVARWLPRSWVSWSLFPHPFSSGPRCLLLFFSSVVCVRVFWVSLLPVGRCPRLGVAGFGWVVPRRPFGGSRLRCRLGGGVGRLLWCWWAVWWLWAVLAPPPCLFFWGGVCLFLPLPSVGWRTHWSAFRVAFRFAVGGCIFPGCAPVPWVGWVMYTLGSAPLLAGLTSGSAGWAGAPGGCVWPWVSRVLSSPRCRL